jgi:pimeloyl-ACP methyl ester carboxylesterase
MGVRRAYLDLPDGQLHLRTAGGSGETPIVFLHQVSSSGAMYERLIEELVREHPKRPMVAFDMPGFGQSYFPPEPPTTAYYVDVFHRAMDSLGIDRAHVVGHHTGAMLGGELAVSHPHAVASLTLLGPWYATEAEREEWRREGIEPMVVAADGSHLKATWDRLGRLDDRMDPQLHHREVVDSLRAGERYHEAYVALSHQDFRALLEQVDCPLLIMGAERDVLAPYYDSVCAAKPEARSLMLKGAGVFAVDEATPEIAAELGAFLEFVGEAQERLAL